MNTRAIKAIVRKDLKVALQNKGVVLPMIILPLILFVIFPWIWHTTILGERGRYSLSNMDELLARMPPVCNELGGYTPEQQLTVFPWSNVAPMFLIMPLMVSSVFAADSFR